MQVINNAVHLLMQASIFLLKEFNNWKAVTPKTYPALKRWHIQDASWHSNCVTLQGNRGRCLPPITCTTCSPTKSQQRQHCHYCNCNNKHCSVNNRKHHHRNHPGIGCKRNQPTQCKLNCAHEPDGCNVLRNIPLPPPPSKQTVPTTYPATHHSSAVTFCRGCIWWVQPWKWRRWQGGAQQTGMRWTWGQS
jgi:hypothetical protein